MDIWGDVHTGDTARGEVYNPAKRARRPYKGRSGGVVQLGRTGTCGRGEVYPGYGTGIARAQPMHLVLSIRQFSARMCLVS